MLVISSYTVSKFLESHTPPAAWARVICEVTLIMLVSLVSKGKVRRVLKKRKKSSCKKTRSAYHAIANTTPRWERYWCTTISMRLNKRSYM